MKRLAIAGSLGLALLVQFACDHASTAPARDGLALDVVSGNGQTGVVGTQLAPLIVKVTNTGNPVAGQVLNFRVVAGSGSVYGGTELTDSHGIAQELWTLGTKAGDPQSVEVRAVETSTGAEKVFGTFSATAVAGPAAIMKSASGDGETTGVGVAVAIPPTVLVTDQYGNPVAGSAVGFAVASGGGNLTGSGPTTGANGTAAVGSWTLGATAGANTLTATSAGLTGSPLTFTATGVGPAGLNISNSAGDGQSGGAGSALSIAPSVQVTDQSSHPVAGVAVTFAVTAGGGSVTGASQLTDANGRATVGSWTLGPATGVNELEATFNTGLSRGATIFVATGNGNFWTTKAPMPTAISGAVYDVIGGKLYMAGGQVANNCAPISSLEVYDPATDSWTTGASMPTARWYGAGAAVNGILYVMGGEGGGCPGPVYHTVEAYNPVTNSWTTKAPMPTARTFFGVALVNGILYAIGGGSAGAQNVVEAYDPASNTWTTKASMPTARANLTVAVVNGIIYAIGGNGCCGYVSTVEAYNPTTNTWTTRAPTPTLRAGTVSGVIQGVIYVAGGQTPSTFLNTLESYDPAADHWSTLPPMPTVRGNAMGGVVGNRLYVAGGQVGGPVFLNSNEAYTP